MYILAFETSCDDTSLALMKDDVCVAISTRTQMEHEVTGGVVPEVAARSHANAIFPCIDDVLREVGITLGEVDYFACTEKPGLMPSLLTGLTVARSLALAYEKPLLLIDHIEGHIFANFLERNQEDIHFPNLTLTVSGGHTEIYLWKSLFELELVSQTRDDAAGECFDKVSKMMGLGFPGGAKIARLASEFDLSAPEDEKIVARNLFPRGLISDDSLDFSFSGTKSAIKRYIDTLEDLSEYEIQCIAYATESAIVDVLVEKLFLALKKYGISHLCLAGGVSANTKLRDTLLARADALSYTALAPKKIIYSMDNAAMIGIRAYYQIRYATA